jgi:phage tail sheath protein FI
MANPPGIRFRESEVQLAPQVTGASLGAMIGQSTRGRVDKAQLVDSWAAYTELYGGFGDSYDLSLAMWDYFRNGGSVARIVRLPGGDAVQASTATTALVDYGAVAPVRIYAADPGVWGNSISVSLFSRSAVSSAAESAFVTGAVDLPKAANAGGSQDMKKVALASVRDVRVGDVYTVRDANGALVGTAPVVVMEIDAANKAIRYKNTDGAVAIGHTLTSASRHLGSAKATGPLAQGGKTLALDSVDGFEKGSLVSIIYSSVFESNIADLDDSSRAVLLDAVVEKVVGSTLHFVAGVVLPGGFALPVSTAAKDTIDLAVSLGGDAASILTVTADSAGAVGNSIQLKFVSSVTAVKAGSIVVSGQTATITFRGGDNANAVSTANDIVALLALSGLVTGVATADVELEQPDGTSFVATLSGGANLQAVSQEFDLVLKEGGVEVEAGIHTGLSLHSNSSNYIGTRLGGALDATFGFQVPSDSSQSVRIIAGNLSDVSLVADLPLAVEDFALADGLDGASATDDDIIGGTSPRKGLHLFDAADDIDIMLAPGFSSPFVQQGIIAYAEGRGDVLALLDMPAGVVDAESMAAHRSQSLGSSSSYAALYAPYGKMPDPRSSVPRGSLVEVPPTPAVAGLIAKRADAQGAHVPAANQELAWAGVVVNLTEAEHGALNDLGINVIKLVRRTGIRLFGARTLSSAIDGRRFTNVRRWLNFMKQSLGASLQGFVFRPAGLRLFSDIQSAVDHFLGEQWAIGALYPQDRKSSAYFVKCDSETTSSVDLANGVVNCEIGVSPVTPAEHIVFSINVSAGGVRVEEQ